MMQVWIRYVAKGRNPLETSDSLFVELALKDAFKRASFQEVDSILFKHCHIRRVHCHSGLRELPEAYGQNRT